jgi:cystathionine beta-lyase/cystathionine gamma-synthase
MDTQHMHTQAVHAGERPDPSYGDSVAPIHMATTFYLGSAEEGADLFSGQREGFVYNRWGSPNQSMLEEKVAALDGAETALAAATGMAAISTALFSVLKAGDHVVATDSLYSGTQHIIAHELPRFGIETTIVDATEPANVERALEPNTTLLYLETPGNPTLKISDIAALTAIARQRGIITFLDNTFATSINQRPLELGVDVTLYSATKYMAGHGQAMGGMMVGSRALIDKARTGALRYLGGTISPFNAWLIMLGMHTYPLRVERQSQSALELARWLEDHPAVEWVRYPGLESHPQHAIARKQMRAYGGMICFELRGGIEAGARMMNRIKLATLAVSLGHTKTLVCHAASTTHSTLSAAERQAAGVSDGLVRLSVGLEDLEDLMQDLDQAMRE